MDAGNAKNIKRSWSEGNCEHWWFEVHSADLNGSAVVKHIIEIWNSFCRAHVCLSLLPLSVSGI